jgi:poly(A) polymerase
MALTIPPARWEAFPGLSSLAEVLGATRGEARYVGGAVRDTLLGVEVADVDIATRHAPEAVMTLLRAAGIKAIPTGLAHGTVTAVVEGRPIEVTTLRRDLSTDGRHAIVAFTDDWREDAARRDFTMNALYADPVTGAVVDFFDGLTDLAARRVRFIGDPFQRIAEDYLRILRFFRFHARFGDAIDAQGLDACAARARDLMALSRERIASELLKLLVARAAVPVVRLMVERGIFAPVLPEVDADGAARLAALARAEDETGIAPDPIRRLAALVPAAAADAVGARLKLSNADRKRLGGATAGPGSEGVRALAYRVGITAAVDRLLLAGEDPRVLGDWAPPRLPIGGGALVARGLSKGPLVAQGLKMVEDRWIAEGFPPPDRVDQIADAVAIALRDASSASASEASSGRA